MPMYHGILRKMQTQYSNPIEYRLNFNHEQWLLNDWIGKVVHLKLSGEIHCLGCGVLIKKSYQQGYCFPCTQKLAACDICMVRPEKCHYDKGTCREPEWGKKHCMIPHIVYLANTSGLKVGVTRYTQMPTRWIDQGASQALPILTVQNRYQSGLLEVLLAKEIPDKTNWRKMLKENVVPLDLLQEKDRVLGKIFEKEPFFNQEEGIQIIEEKPVLFHYPILQYPAKIIPCSINTGSITGTLLGIKGQYLLFDIGVLNIRSLSGHHVTVEING